MKNVNLSDIKVLFDENEIRTKVKEIANKLNEYYKDEEVCIVCVLKGAVIFATDLVRELTMPLTMEFIRLSSYGHSTASSGKVNAVDIKLPDLTGKNVLIVEDIIDTGLTAKFLLDFIALNFKTKSTKFVSLLDKKCSRQADVEADYYCFEIDDKFVVGYGLDYDSKFRNLKFIGYADKSVIK
ncbi:MAG: hypoxanthine phosphoribosyltransferase [Candidatus Gastranaerophilaceae bacterium]|nr:hypoxanthine phosphoribosyltransferase [Candidatus Gastranaerophilaceae bacterium]